MLFASKNQSCSPLARIGWALIFLSLGQGEGICQGEPPVRAPIIPEVIDDPDDGPGDNPGATPNISPAPNPAREIPEPEEESRPIPPDAWDPAAALLVLYNTEVPESVELANFYAQQRRIPESRLIGLPCSAAETISRDEYDLTIRAPLIELFNERKYWKLQRENPSGALAVSENPSVRIIAPVFGIPTRISRSHGADGGAEKPPKGYGNESSVDSELALLGAFGLDLNGPIKNPYFEKDTPFSALDAPPMFLITRLDGPSPEVVKRMIQDAVAVEKSGLSGFCYFDLAEKGAGYEAGDLWIRSSERLFRSQGFPTVVDTYPQRFPPYYPLRDAAIYFGWYHDHVDGPFLNPDFSFTRGAIACHLHSFSAQDLRQSTRRWTGPLLKRGAAASLGNVWEPYLALTVHFDLLTDRLLKGYTFAESVAMATPALSWMNIAVGDPLYRPFGSRLVGPPVGAVPRSESDYALIRRYTLGKTGESQANLKRALTDAAVNRGSGILLESAGLLSAADDRFSEATELFEHAFETYEKAPDRIRVKLHIADMCMRSGDPEGAGKIYREILASFPKSIEARSAKELLQRLTGEDGS